LVSDKVLCIATPDTEFCDSDADGGRFVVGPYVTNNLSGLSYHSQDLPLVHAFPIAKPTIPLVISLTVAATYPELSRTCPDAQTGGSFMVQRHENQAPITAILTTPAEIEQWMTAPADEALKLQRPLPDGSLTIVATGQKEDGAG
jgi:hypothetical protein